MSEKIYCGTGKVLAGKDGMPDRLKLSFGPNDLEALRANVNEKGWVSIVVAKRREPSASGQTHYGVVDTWRPTNQSPEPAAAQHAAAKEEAKEGAGDLPF